MPSGGISVRFGSKPYRLQASTCHYQLGVPPLTATTTVLPSIVTLTVPSATVGTAYSKQLVATGGSPPYTWSKSSSVPGTGGFPTCSTSGLLSGTPSTAETETLVIQVADRVNHTASKSYSLPVASNTIGFIPDSGWSYSTSATDFEGTFTVNSLTNSLSANAPTLLMFDDLRGKTVNTLLTAGQTGVLGSGVYGDNGSPALTPMYRRTNRGGVNPAMSMLDNERAGGPSGLGPFGRRTKIPIGSAVTGIYIFYAEKWYGWNGRNNEGGGGGYYKHNWITNAADSSPGLAYWDCVLADFVEQCGTGPGSGGTGVPCADIPTMFIGNSWGAHGLPSGWFPAGDSAGISKWDTSGWNSYEAGLLGAVGNPTGAVGTLYHALYNATNHQAINAQDKTRILFSATPHYGSFDMFSMSGLMQNIGVATVDRCDIYIAVGNNCYVRFFITDASTLAASTTMMPSTINSISAATASITLRKGAFTSPSGNWLWYSDASNTITRVGQFA